MPASSTATDETACDRSLLVVAGSPWVASSSDRNRMSEISASSRWVSPDARATKSRRVPASMAGSPSASSSPRRPVSGVRSSWETLATNCERSSW